MSVRKPWFTSSTSSNQKPSKSSTSRTRGCSRPTAPACHCRGSTSSCKSSTSHGLLRGIVHSSPSARSRSSSKSGSSTGCSRSSSKQDDKHCSSSAHCGSTAVIVLKTATHHRTTKSLSKESKPSSPSKRISFSSLIRVPPSSKRSKSKSIKKEIHQEGKGPGAFSCIYCYHRPH